jgi:hypothetical protein
MYRVNCIILGGNLHSVFVIDIAPTQTVAHLKDFIKDKTKQRFDRVDANCLKLWKASDQIPVI